MGDSLSTGTAGERPVAIDVRLAVAIVVLVVVVAVVVVIPSLKNKQRHRKEKRAAQQGQQDPPFNKIVVARY